MYESLRQVGKMQEIQSALVERRYKRLEESGG
jgi:DNA-binding transcriptional regulator YhcF (GntR family)